MQWTIGKSRTLILDRVSQDQRIITYIDDAVRKKHEPVKWGAPKRSRGKVFGGPYYLKGWRPGWTKWVTLTQGTYTMEGRHEGKGNFIVHMVSRSDKDLMFNEVGHSYDYQIVHVREPTKPVRFLVKRAGGPWEINIKRSPGESETSKEDATLWADSVQPARDKELALSAAREKAKIAASALWANSMRQVREREQALSHSRAEALAAARAKMEGKPDETGLIYLLTNPAVPGCIRIGRAAGDVQHEVDELNKSVPFAYELHSITKVYQSRMIELAIRQFLPGAEDGAHYRVDPQTVNKQLVKMARENNAHLTDKGSTKTIMASQQVVPTATGSEAKYLKVHNLKQKTVKRERGREKRAWRVAVTNTSRGPIDVSIKVEWVDSDGFQVNWDIESRVIEPGDHSFGEVEWLEADEVTNAKTFRISAIKARRP